MTTLNFDMIQNREEEAGVTQVSRNHPHVRSARGMYEELQPVASLCSCLVRFAVDTKPNEESSSW